FANKLPAWFQRPLSGKRIVATNHAPVINPMTKSAGSAPTPAFNFTDVIDIIDQYQPELWIYGHINECDEHYRGKTRIISNQMEYQFHQYQYECEDNFNSAGKPMKIDWRTFCRSRQYNQDDLLHAIQPEGCVHRHLLFDCIAWGSVSCGRRQFRPASPSSQSRRVGGSQAICGKGIALSSAKWLPATKCLKAGCGQAWDLHILDMDTQCRI
ncbi:MAG: hypothetical protein OXC72_14890, partial [Roseovarius sp.]|nr:hypothetical protein [Roseovarius sp.]